MNCKKCGAPLKEGDRFCEQCGTPVEEMSQKRSKTLLWIMLGVLLFIVIAVVGGKAVYDYFYPNKNVESTDDKTQKKEEIPSDKDKEDKDKEDKDKDDKVKEAKNDDNKIEDEEEKEAGIVEVEDETEDEKEDQPAYVAPVQDVDVEEQVLVIREEYNDITSKVSNGTYTEEVLSEGVLGYYNGSELKEIVVYAGVDGNDYRRFYYFDEGELMFAYYEGDDAHRFYFYEGSLIRWRYSKDTANAQDAVNHDLESSSQYIDWEIEVLNDAKKYY